MENSEAKKYNWPGWQLSKNEYGEEFDLDARKRMVTGSRKLIPYLLKYKHKLAGSVCEIGPFFNPLVNHDEISAELTPTTRVTFFENDKFAINYLKQTIDCVIIDVDLNSPANFLNIEDHKGLDNEGVHLFDIIIMSQVLNYVDYLSLLNQLYNFLADDGLIFINNSVNYGIPELFSKKRPKSNRGMMKTIGADRYEILEQALLPKEFATELYKRLILILAKK